MKDESYSVVIPMYRSEETIAKVVNEVTQAFLVININNYEIILINDCSPDNVLDKATILAKNDAHITVLDLAKNVGQEMAALAGYSYAKGDFIISVDDDFQHPAYEIGNLITAIHDRDDDVVFASYMEEEGRRPWFRSLGTRLNWKMAEIMTGKPKNIESNSFLIMRRNIRDSIINYRGKDMYTYGVIYATTSHISNYPVKHRKRITGSSGNTLPKLIRLWFSGAISFSLKLLKGLCLLTLIGLLLSIFLIAFGKTIIGLLVVAIITTLNIYVFGEYIGRLYLVSENLPKYVIKNVITYNKSHSK